MANPTATGVGKPEIKVEPGAGAAPLDSDLIDRSDEMMELIDRTDAIDEETAAFMKARLADSTRASYISRLTSFIVWILDDTSRHYLLNTTILPLLLDADKSDKSAKTKRGKKSQQRKNLRLAITSLLEGVDKTTALTFPVVLGKLSFMEFARYLATYKKTVTTKKKRSRSDTTVSAGGAKICLSASSYDAACSALAFLFTECGVPKDYNEVTKDLWNQIGLYKKGVRRTGAKQRKKLGLTTSEGKKPLPFKAFEYLARILFESDKPEHIAAHTFLCIDPRLSRAELSRDLKGQERISCPGRSGIWEPRRVSRRQD